MKNLAEYPIFEQRRDQQGKKGARRKGEQGGEEEGGKLQETLEEQLDLMKKLAEHPI
jgi:hypothetical protein